MGKNDISKLLDKESILKRYKNGETINKIRLDCKVTHKVIKLIVEKSGVVFNKHPKYTKWNKEDIIKEARNYKHRSHFMKGSPSAYHAAHRINLKEAFEHMEPLGHVKSRLVYVYEFPDNHVYVGLTANKNKRHGEHMRDSRGPIYKHMTKIGVAPRYRMISNWYINYSEAQQLEKDTVNEYKEKGWIIMNTAPAGNLGGNLYKWNEDNLRELALKYNTRGEMMRNNRNAFEAIKQKNLYHLFDHMEWEGNIEHTLEECIEEAKKYTCRQDFRKHRYDLWQWTYKHKHQEVVFAHMVKKQIPYRWTIENALKIMNQYEYLNDFIKEQPRCHRFISRNLNYREVTKHMKKRKPYENWDEDRKTTHRKKISKSLGKSCIIYNEDERLEFSSLRELERFFWDKGYSKMSRYRFKEGEIIRETNYYFTRTIN